MLTENEKQEMREMAGSALLREEFRTMRRNSRAIEDKLNIDELIHWLTAMARVSPPPANIRPFIYYTNVKL